MIEALTKLQNQAEYIRPVDKYNVIIKPKPTMRVTTYETIIVDDDLEIDGIFERDSFGNPSIFKVRLIEELIKDLEEYLDELVSPLEFDCVAIDEYDQNKNELIAYYTARGGYEYDCNAYWGGEEYVEDLVKSIEHPRVKEVEYNYDGEDMSGYITLHLQ